MADLDDVARAVERAAKSVDSLCEYLRSERDGATRQTCAECGRAWLDPTDRWRAYRTDDGLELFCPDCAAAEFDT